MRSSVALALASLAVASPAFAVVTGNLEYRFVTIAGTGALPNQGTGIADGTVLGPNTVITADNALIRQRIALQVRAVGIGGDFVGNAFNGSNTALVPGSTIVAQNLGVFGSGGGISFGDGTIAGNSLANSPFPTSIGGMVAGSSWTGFQGVIGTGTLPAQAWPFTQANPPAPANPSNTGAGGAWVEVARFRWESSDLTARTIAATFTNNPGVTAAFVGNSVASASFPDADNEVNGSVTYATSLANLPAIINNFSFLIEGGVGNTAPTSVASPAMITADPFVNPDALDLVLASFTDADGDNVSVTLDAADVAAIEALGGSVTVAGNNGTAPTIVLNWDAPNAAIGQTFTIDYTYTDGTDAGGAPLSTSVTVVPAPGALALLGFGGLIAGRRRRA